ncbi:MAG: hypothetical protein A2020_00310 [Lentisphaerae bacterium GWF2_45_14]|nr:MAG: hypothetical protein A2020_00310 [Lentisphaerae bacterium GWF2_45_14]
MMDENLFTDGSKWCWHPDVRSGTACFIIFRHEFRAEEAELKLKINVSADNRYNLYLDGILLGRGPCRGDLSHYNYETYVLDIPEGRHVLSAEVVVYYHGPCDDAGPISEVHAGGGFIVAGGVFKEEVKLIPLDTSGNWKCSIDHSRSLVRRSDCPVKGFMAIAQMEKVDFAFALCSGWKQCDYDDSGWTIPESIESAIFSGRLENTSSRWWLTPRTIPMLEESAVEIKGLIGWDPSLLEDGKLKGLSVSVGCELSFIMDMGELCTGFPLFSFVSSGGAELVISYSESLFVDGEKQVRDDKSGTVFGYSDYLSLDSGSSHFEPFWFRTFRFIGISIKNVTAPFEIKEISVRSFMYPFELKASFSAMEDVDFVPKIWETAWRTSRLCAHEHYEDCPYYEQLQYAGDTRIQALISYALTGDGRLGLQAVRQFDWSMLPEGITQSRYPSSWVQVIPQFSLFWIMMIDDYYWYSGDKQLVLSLMPGIKSVMEWFGKNRSGSGLISGLNYWNFIDWVDEWRNGSPGRNPEDVLTINSLLYAEACRRAAFLCEECALPSDEYKSNYKDVICAVDKYCFDEDLCLYVDIPGNKGASQHTNAWAIISGAAGSLKTESIVKGLAENPQLQQASLYFSFYLFRAWELSDNYRFFWKQLEKWKSIFKWNFTTFPEIPSPETRSDCHGWSASPLYEFVSRVLGIRPLSPGFKDILVKPMPGGIRKASGKAPAGNNMAGVSWITTECGEMEIKLDFQHPADVKLVWPDGFEEFHKELKSGIFSRELLCQP